jgi:hypothetical protein
MNSQSVDPKTLRSAVHGDIGAMFALLGATHEALTTAANQAGPLILRPDDVARVLKALQEGSITRASAKEWASFVRRGYLRGGRGPIRPLDIEYDPARELAMVDAIGRMDELGDMIDGTIGADELIQLIRSLE